MKRKPPPENARRVQHIDENLLLVFRSQKTGKIIQCESFQEFKLGLLLERDKNVKRFVSQPAEAMLWYINSAGRRFDYPPDFLAEHVSGPEIVYEITMNERLELKPNLRERAKNGHLICKERGQVYKQYAEDVLPDDTETANLLVFYGARMQHCDNKKIQDLALDLLADNKKMHMKQLAEEIASRTELDEGTVCVTLKHMIWHGDLEINWKRLFYETTQFTGIEYARDAFVWVKQS